jgi:hypothetical protein
MNKMKRYAGADESLVGGAEDERPAPTGMGEIAETRADKMMGEDVIDEETGAKSKYKRNPETGELYNPEPEMTKPKPKKKKPSFSEKARKAGFTSAETKGGAALMYRNPMGKKMASGGTASSRADGIAQRGKTRGKMC